MGLGLSNTQMGMSMFGLGGIAAVSSANSSRSNGSSATNTLGMIGGVGMMGFAAYDNRRTVGHQVAKMGRKMGGRSAGVHGPFGRVASMGNMVRRAGLRFARL